MVSAVLIAMAQAQGVCPDLRATVDQAHEALLTADVESAEDLRDRALDAVGCGAPGTADTVAKLWLVEGVLAGLGDDPGTATLAFTAVRRLNADLWDPVYGEALSELWEDAGEEAPASTGGLDLAPSRGEPWVVWIDGAPQPLPATLPAGLHVLQVVDDRDQVHLGRLLRVLPDESARVTHTLPETPPAPPEVASAAGGVRVSPIVATGITAGFGEVLESGGDREGAAKLLVPLELGAQVEGGAVWARASVDLGVSLAGPYLYASDGEVGRSVLAAGGHVAAGPIVGRTRLGILAGAQWPGRLPLHAVVAVPLGELPLRVEGRAGVHLATERSPEPSGALRISWIPLF